jgi:hypothetical protein
MAVLRNVILYRVGAVRDCPFRGSNLVSTSATGQDYREQHIDWGAS